MFGRLVRILADRFVLFVALGAMLFVWESWGREDASIIRFEAGDISMIEGRWIAQNGTVPSPDELQALIDFQVREEVLVREAIRLGLDRGDSIIRRRLVQKMEFLIQNQIRTPTPSQEELLEYFEQNKSAYKTPPMVSFQHIFLKVVEEEAVAQAEIIKETLAGDIDPDLWRSFGAPFMFDREWIGKFHSQVGELFGREFADSVFALEPSDTWVGPIKSTYGWHCVRVLASQPERAPRLDEVRARVLADMGRLYRAQAEGAAWQKIRSRYSVSNAGAGE